MKLVRFNNDVINFDLVTRIVTDQSGGVTIHFLNPGVVAGPFQPNSLKGKAILEWVRANSEDITPGSTPATPAK